MPNPSTITADIEAQYEEHLNRSGLLGLSKSSREYHLGEARRLAAELGIEGPPNINGRPAVEPQPAKTVVVLSDFQKGIIVNALREANKVDGAIDELVESRNILIEVFNTSTVTISE